MNENLHKSKEKQLVIKLFNSIAKKYDLANHILSFGIDRRWRKTVVKITKPAPRHHLLDICTGTGNLAFTFASIPAPPQNITACDFSCEMINIAIQKQKKLKLPKPINFNWITADCKKTDLPENSFDIITCAFGIRNIENPQAALKEMLRILKPNGKICILEFSLPKKQPARSIYLFYLTKILPICAAIITGNKAQYKYLAKSVVKWANETDLNTKLNNTGFKNVSTKKLTCGIASCYTATK